MKRAPRNFVPVLTKEQKKLLNRIVELHEELPYPPAMGDLSTPETYGAALRRVHRLEELGWVQVNRDARGRIRSIVPLMKL